MRCRFVRRGHDGFAPACLVGMSMSARKRAARAECVGHPFRRRVKLVWFKCWARDVHRRVMTADDQQMWSAYETARAKYRMGQRVRFCGCWYWGDRDCELCGSQRIMPVNTPEQRRQHRRRERSRIAWNHSGCAHDIDEWLDAGRECPSKDEHGVCNEIPF